MAVVPAPAAQEFGLSAGKMLREKQLIWNAIATLFSTSLRADATPSSPIRATFYKSAIQSNWS